MARRGPAHRNKTVNMYPNLWTQGTDYRDFSDKKIYPEREDTSCHKRPMVHATHTGPCLNTVELRMALEIPLHYTSLSIFQAFLSFSSVFQHVVKAKQKGKNNEFCLSAKILCEYLFLLWVLLELPNPDAQFSG